MTIDRISVGPAVMADAPSIRGVYVPFATIVAMADDGMTTAELLVDLPYLERAEIDEALRFAADQARQDDRHTP